MAAFTFHLPFIVAAMVLGGPIAGGWVALMASFEHRELREAPWYGTLANHASLALAAILGVAAQAAVAAASALALPGGLAITLVGVAVGTLVLTVAQTALAAGVIVLRDGLAPRHARAVRPLVPGHAARRDAARLGVPRRLVAVGWWAPAPCRARSSPWRSNRRGARSRRAHRAPDATRLCARRRGRDRGRRGVEGAAYCSSTSTVQGVNDGPRCHPVGDEALAALGERLRRGVRSPTRRGAGAATSSRSWSAGVPDEATAERLAGRIHDPAHGALCPTDDGIRKVGASIGVALAVPGGRDFEPDLRQRADDAMYAAKEAGGGVHAWRPAPDVAARPPRATVRRGRPRRLAGDQRPRRPDDHRDVRERAHEAGRDGERGDKTCQERVPRDDDREDRHDERHQHRLDHDHRHEIAAGGEGRDERVGLGPDAVVADHPHERQGVRALCAAHGEQHPGGGVRCPRPWRMPQA